MSTGPDRIGYLQQLHAEYNEQYFHGLLMPITILIKRHSTNDGWYEFTTEKRDGEWRPRRDRLHKACIVICEWCWEYDCVEGTLLHEMIHQYQAEVLDTDTHHDSVFRAWARGIEEDSGYELI